MTEDVLPDDYPVYYGYAYVCDGRPRSSPIAGAVADLKRFLGVSEVRRCDLVSRTSGGLSFVVTDQSETRS